MKETLQKFTDFSVFVGNDIVDLQNPTAHPRFLQRICTSEEQKAVLAYSEPSTALWTLWAIKEATYKAVKKLDPNARFLPKQFTVHDRLFLCHYKHLQANIYLIQTKDYVHATALLSEYPLTVLQELKLEDQWRISCSTGSGQVIQVISSIGILPKEALESDAVRKLALTMLKEIGYADCKIIREKKDHQLLPPQVHKEKRVENLDISLSHDGHYLAATLGIVN